MIDGQITVAENVGKRLAGNKKRIKYINESPRRTVLKMTRNYSKLPNIRESESDLPLYVKSPSRY